MHSNSSEFGRLRQSGRTCFVGSEGRGCANRDKGPNSQQSHTTETPENRGGQQNSARVTVVHSTHIILHRFNRCIRIVTKGFKHHSKVPHLLIDSFFVNIHQVRPDF